MITPQRAGVPPIMPSPVPGGGAGTTTASVWAPELDMNSLERQLDHYADQTVKAAAKVQMLPNTELSLLRAAAESNRFGSSVSPRRGHSPSGRGGGGDEQQQQSAGGSDNNPFRKDGKFSGDTTWRSLNSLPPYILRLMFAAGQMCEWLVRSPSSESPSRQNPHRPVAGNFGYLVLGVHHGVPVDPERVVEYLTEFSEFPQISEVELVLHETMTAVSGSSHSSSSSTTPKKNINNLPHVRAVVPATEGELLQMSPTQRAQFASDVLACHRSPVIYAVRQWCFAIGRYLLLLDQWIRLHYREIRVLSRERTRQMELADTPRSSRDEEEEIERSLHRKRSDMVETFRDRFYERGGLQVLLGSHSSDGDGNGGSDVDGLGGDKKKPAATSARDNGSKAKAESDADADDRAAAAASAVRDAVAAQQEQQQQQQQRQEERAAAAAAVSTPSRAAAETSTTSTATTGTQKAMTESTTTQTPIVARVSAATLEVSPATTHASDSRLPSEQRPHTQQQQPRNMGHNAAVETTTTTTTIPTDVSPIPAPSHHHQRQQDQIGPGSPFLVGQYQSSSGAAMRPIQTGGPLRSPPRAQSVDHTASLNRMAVGVVYPKNISPSRHASAATDATNSSNNNNNMSLLNDIGEHRSRAADASATLSRLQSNHETEERQRAMALVDSLRQELAAERSKRQQAESECTTLRLAASKSDAKITENALHERQQAERQIVAMRAQLDAALADTTAAQKSRNDAEAARDELSASLRTALRQVDDAKEETNMKVQQLLQAGSRSENTLLELREAKQALERSEARAKTAEKEAEDLRIHATLNRTPSVTPSREYSRSSASPGSAAQYPGGLPPAGRSSGAAGYHRTVDGSMILAPAAAAHSSVLGVYQGTTATDVAASEILSLEQQRRMSVALEELECRVAFSELVRASLSSELTFASGKLTRATDALVGSEKQVKELQELHERVTKESTGSAQSEIIRLKQENYELQKKHQDLVYDMQAKNATKSSQDEARIRSLESELATLTKQKTSEEEGMTQLRFQAADSEHRLKAKYHEEQQLRVQTEIALRTESEKNVRLLQDIETLSQQRQQLEDLNREAVQEVRRVASSSDDSSRALSQRVSELEKACEKYMRENEDLRRQLASLNGELESSRRHNATLDSQVSIVGARAMADASATSNVLVDALKTKIDALETKNRDSETSHQNAIHHLEQRVSKLRSENLSQIESAEHSLFEARRNLQTATHRADMAEQHVRDLDKRVKDTEVECDSLRHLNRDLSQKLQSANSTRSDNEALKQQLAYVEEDVTNKRAELTQLRSERSEMYTKMQESMKSCDEAKMERDNQIRIAQQTLVEFEKARRANFDEAADEAENRAKAKYDKDLLRVVAQVEDLAKREREQLRKREQLEGELSKAQGKIGQLEEQNKQMAGTISDMRDMVQLLKVRDGVGSGGSGGAALSPMSQQRQQEEDFSVGGRHIPAPPSSPPQQQQQQQHRQQHQQPSTPPPPPAESQLPEKLPPNPFAPQQKQTSDGPVETLTTIAERVGLPVEDLLAANPNISSATQRLVRGTRIVLPPVKAEDRNSATTSTTDLGAGGDNNGNNNNTTPSTSVPTAMETSVLRQQQSVHLDDHANWNSLQDLVEKLFGDNKSNNHNHNNKIDMELLKQLNEDVCPHLEQPIPPGGNVIIPINDPKLTPVPSLAAIRSKLGLEADGAVRLRDNPEPNDPSRPLPRGSILNIFRSLENPQGATLLQIARRLTMPVGALLEANPAIKHEDELVPFFKTVFVPRREDPEDSLSVSWRRSRRHDHRRGSATGGGVSNDSISSMPAAAGGRGSALTDDSDAALADNITKRPPWTLDETAKRCGVSFDELMKANSSAFPGTCRLPEDLLPHFVPFKFILRPFRRSVHPTRIQDLSRMVKMPVEELLKVNSGVSSGTSLLWPGQTLKVPCRGRYLRDSNGNALSVGQVAAMLNLSPIEFLRDNSRQFMNLTEHVTGEFFITVRDVDSPNFGDFILQLGTVEPAKLKEPEPEKKPARANLFDRLRDAMDYGPRNDPNYEDEEELEDEAKRALLKARRNSNDYWASKRGNAEEDDGLDHSNARNAAKASQWETGWVSRVSVREQKEAEEMRRQQELEEIEATSAARIRHLPLLSSAERRSQSMQRQYEDGAAPSSSSSRGTSPGGGGTSRPGSAAAYYHRHGQHSTPPPLASLDLPQRPSSATAIRQKVAANRQQQQQQRDGGGDASTTTSFQKPPPEPAKPPRKPDLPEELLKFIRSEVQPTNKENTMQFFDFTRFRKDMNDANFKEVISIVSRKQPQSLVSVYFQGVSTVSPDMALKGMAMLVAFCPHFKEFTTDEMQFPPGVMAQIRLLINRKEELRATKWIFESCIASQRSIMHLKGKKLTDASVVLLDALDEFHPGHTLNIFDLRENFLTHDTGRTHIINILKREWSPVTSILVDDNPDMSEKACEEIATLAEKKERKQLEWMHYQQQMQSQQYSQSRGAASVSQLTDAIFDSSVAKSSRGGGAFDDGPFSPTRALESSARVTSPSQRQFQKRFG